MAHAPHDLTAVPESNLVRRRDRATGECCHRSVERAQVLRAVVFVPTPCNKSVSPCGCTLEPYGKSQSKLKNVCTGV